MKERIFSIMDMRKKKSGLALLCAVLTLTLGTGSAFAASAETQSPSPGIKEDIMVSLEFLPDPALYGKYASYGIAVSDDGKRLLYNGQRVRLFTDEHSDAEAFFYDEAGTLDLAATRDAAGNLTGIERISVRKAQEYRFAFLAADRSAVTPTEDAIRDTVKEIV